MHAGFNKLSSKSKIMFCVQCRDSVKIVSICMQASIKVLLAQCGDQACTV